MDSNCERHYQIAQRNVVLMTVPSQDACSPGVASTTVTKRVAAGGVFVVVFVFVLVFVLRQQA